MCVCDSMCGRCVVSVWISLFTGTDGSTPGNGVCWTGKQQPHGIEERLMVRLSMDKTTVPHQQKADSFTGFTKTTNTEVGWHAIQERHGHLPISSFFTCSDRSIVGDDLKESASIILCNCMFHKLNIKQENAYWDSRSFIL